MNSWNNLSIKEKADVMKVAIQNGITTLPEIKAKYNEFAEGGEIDFEDANLYGLGDWINRVKGVFTKDSNTNAPTKKIVYKSKYTGRIWKNKEDAIQDSKKYFKKPDYRMQVKADKYGSVNPTTSYSIPFIESKKRTLTNAGLATGAVISENMLDSIAKHAENVGLPVKTALGIATKETTLGNWTDDKTFHTLFKEGSYNHKVYRNMYNAQGTQQHINPGIDIDERALVNYHDERNPYREALEYADKNSVKGIPQKEWIDGTGSVKAYSKYIDLLSKGESYADKQAEKLKNVSKTHVLDAAFSKFKNNPDSYNPGQPNYSQLVTKRADEIWNSPEIQAWWKKYQNNKALGGNLFSGTENHSSQMHQGHVYDVLPRMLRNAGLDVRVTSGYRKAGAAGKAGSKSWHTKHGAVDIVPQGKTTFSDIEDALYNNPEISSYMLANGFGLIDESGRTEESKATMRKTGATGAHFHIGKDSAYAKRYADRMAKNVPQIMPESPSIQTYDAPAFMPSNPQVFFNPFAYQAPQIEPEIEQPLVEVALNNAYTPEQLEREQRMNNLNTLSMVLGMTSPQGSDNSFVNTLGMLAGNMSAYGGNLFYPGGEITFGRPYYSYNDKGELVLDENGKPILNYNANVPEIIVTGHSSPKKRPITTGGAGYFPSMTDDIRKGVDKFGNITKAGAKAAIEYVKAKNDAPRKAGITFLKNLDKENQLEALDAVMHSTKGGEVMSSNDLLEVGLPNYFKNIQGKPMDINYTGNSLNMGEYNEPTIVNTKRDLVNLYLKGDTTGFEDVTEDPRYSHGADYKKYINTYYPDKSIRTYKMSSDGEPLYLNEEEIAYINTNKLNKPEYRHEGWTVGGDNIANMIRWYKNIDGQLYAVDSDIWDFNPKDWKWEGDDNKIVDKVGTPFILKALRPIHPRSEILKKKYVDGRWVNP